MIEKISDKVWKINADSNIYVIDKKIVIDAGNREYHDLVKKELEEVCDLDKIEKVVFTHLHYDHIGNFDLFPNAKFYASKDEIDDFKKEKGWFIFDNFLLENFDVELHELKDMDGLKVVETPGHTRGSICIEFGDILFSGDTLFFNDNYGRIDFPNSKPDLMRDSLGKLEKIDFKILCPGHDY